MPLFWGAFSMPWKTLSHASPHCQTSIGISPEGCAGPTQDVVEKPQENVISVCIYITIHKWRYSTDIIYVIIWFCIHILYMYTVCLLAFGVKTIYNNCFWWDHLQYQRSSLSVFAIFVWTRLFKRIPRCRSNSIMQGVLAVSVKFGSRFNQYRPVLRKTSFVHRQWCSMQALWWPATACCLKGLVARRRPYRAFWQGHRTTALNIAAHL